ncbi:MAG: hypothetical protein LV477_00665 [Candidatus Nitrosotalea sp.]|nr:hypothetical protein [Candidatus Nitrosotalea sp.]
MNRINENLNHYKITKPIGKIEFLSFIGPHKMTKTSVWKKQVHTSFKKVVAFDLLFMMLGGLIGAGIITAVLR